MAERYNNVSITIPALGIENEHVETVIRGANSTYRTFVYRYQRPRTAVAEPDLDVPDEGVYIENQV